jgi:hypothetical protein
VVPVNRWSVPDPATRVATLPAPAQRRVQPRPRALVTAETWLLLVGGGMAMLGSILPWSVATTGALVASENGMHRDGRVTILLGLVVVVVGVVGIWYRIGRGVAVGALVAAVTITVLTGYDAFDLSAFGDAGDQLASLEIGHGLVITVIGGVVAMIGAARVVAHSRPGAEAST